MHNVEGTFPTGNLPAEAAEALKADCEGRGCRVTLDRRGNMTVAGNSEQFDYFRAAYRLSLAQASERANLIPAAERDAEQARQTLESGADGTRRYQGSGQVGTIRPEVPGTMAPEDAAEATQRNTEWEDQRQAEFGGVTTPPPNSDAVQSSPSDDDSAGKGDPEAHPQSAASPVGQNVEQSGGNPEPPAPPAPQS